jgi:AraC-like DNA-binding protein
MFSAIYFAVASTLSSLHAPEITASQILGGRWLEAANALGRRADADAGVKADAADVQLLGDIQLMTGRLEDAEASYRRAQKLLQGARDELRILSCRNTGWQALFREQFSVALNCFKRVMDEAEASAERRLDSLVGMTLVLHQLGNTQAVCAQLDELAALAARHADPRWSALEQALRWDFLTQYDLHRADALADHVYWRSEAVDFLPLGAGDVETPAPHARCAAVTLLADRLRYLERLRALAAGKALAIDTMEPHVQWIRQLGVPEYRRRLNLEIALAAVAACSPNVAETMLMQCEGAGLQHNQHARWYLDYQYCLAKVRQQQGRIQEFSQLYGRYAFASMRHVRADATLVSLIHSLTSQGRPGNADDISARLPGKYRRAYRYMMDNLDQRDLSVREIATHIGVTERAIQAVFKSTLGLSPSQLIRRQRMERIHRSLSDDGDSVTSVLDVAKKWGVQHRSTLINNYRQFFHEAPSETLAR